MSPAWVVGRVRVCRDAVDVRSHVGGRAHAPKDAGDFVNVDRTGIALNQRAFHRLGVDEDEDSFVAKAVAQRVKRVNGRQGLGHDDLSLTWGPSVDFLGARLVNAEPDAATTEVEVDPAGSYLPVRVDVTGVRSVPIREQQAVATLVALWPDRPGRGALF